jgi:5'-nucleotidase / UDP-sugar diphosphatase
MKQFLLLASAFVLLSTVSLFSQTDTVTILHINDTHSNLAPIGPRDASLKGSLGGVARAATLIGMERMANPNALLLHAGDISIGDLFYTKYLAAAELQILGALGCDAMTLGNHEFDLTPAYLDTSLAHGFAGGSFPILCANIFLDDPAVQPLKNYVKPYAIKQTGNVKVGIFGLTTPATNLLSQPAPAVLDTNFIQTAAAMVETLMTKGCNVVICLSHLGVGYDQLVAQNVPGIHLIVGGHDHLKVGMPVQNPVGDTTWIVQANAFYLDLGKVRLTVSGGKVRMLDHTIEPITDAIPEEPTIAAEVDGMIADIESVYGPVFSTKIADVTADFEEVADSLTVPGNHDTPIGCLVTDAFRATTGTQVAMEVGGSTAEPLYHGPIVMADAFRVVGYGFNTVNGLGYRLCTMSMTGAAIYAGIEFGLSSIEQDDEFLVQVSGMSYEYDPLQPAYSRVKWIKVGNAPLDPQATYTVSANEFVPLFLGTFGIPFENLHICGDTTEFSALAGYIQALGTLDPRSFEQRVGRVTTDVDPKQPGSVIPNKYELNQNYPNPFNPSTTIKYTVAGAGPVSANSGDRDSRSALQADRRGQGSEASNVELRVYDVLGREVAVLVNERQTAGAYEVKFNAAGLATGMYLCRLTVGAFTAVRKMMLVK